jgi:hypothetical protein
MAANTPSQDRPRKLGNPERQRPENEMKRFWIKFMASLPLGDTTVLIADGGVVARRGNPRAALLSELSEWVKCNGIHDACVHASTTGASGFRLSLFGIPDSLHQRLRNVWGANWK